MSGRAAALRSPRCLAAKPVPAATGPGRAAHAPPPVAEGGATQALSPALTLLFSIACGLAVASIYYVQPLLDRMADDVGISRAAAGIVFGVAQIGYGLGLLFIVPLGDSIDSRRLIVGQAWLLAIALLGVALAPDSVLLLVALACVGVLAVMAQVLVAYAATLAHPSERGRTVAAVTSGIVFGILLARTGAGALSDIVGWRAVYLVAAIATCVTAVSLIKALRRQPRPAVCRRLAFPRLIGSMLMLFVAERILRIRGMLALLAFAAVTTLLTPMVLTLTAPPHSLSHAQVGLFGLTGLAGVLGALGAGRLADHGHAQRASGLGLSCMLLSWIPAASLPHSLWGLIAGALVLDFGLQAVHVANQSLIYRVRPEARSRIAAGYMIFYSIGSALGAIASTIVYARAGWYAVCLLGAAFSVVAICLWAATRRPSGMAECGPDERLEPHSGERS